MNGINIKKVGLICVALYAAALVIYFAISGETPIETGLGIGTISALCTFTVFGGPRGEPRFYRICRRLRSDGNPLYREGCFRRRSGKDFLWFFDDLKGRFWCQIVGMCHSAVSITYAVCSVTVGRSMIMERYLIAAALLIALAGESISSHYIKRLKKRLSPKTKKIIERQNPLEVIKLRQGFTAVRSASQLRDKIEQAMGGRTHRVLQKGDMEYVQRADWYEKRGAGRREILEVIYIENLSSMVRTHADRWSRMLEKSLSEETEGIPTFVTRLAVCHETTDFWPCLIALDTQERGRYILTAVMVVETGKLYLSGTKEGLGIPYFLHMQESLLRMLEVKRAEELWKTEDYTFERFDWQREGKG